MSTGNFEKYRAKLVMRPQEISNHPEIIRRLGLISINTALEFDIYGNVNSTHVIRLRSIELYQSFLCFSLTTAEPIPAPIIRVNGTKFQKNVPLYKVKSKKVDSQFQNGKLVKTIPALK